MLISALLSLGTGALTAPVKRTAWEVAFTVYILEASSHQGFVEY